MKVYTYNEKKKINFKIEKLKMNHCIQSLTHIAKIIINTYDNSKITNKSNGMWLDFNDVPNITVYLIDKFIKQLDNESLTESETNVDKVIEYKSSVTTCGPKLSNYEKNLIKYCQYNNSMDIQVTNV